MISISLEQVRTLLIVGAHADDIEIGCGATILEIGRSRPDINVRWVVFSGKESRANEARQSAGEFLSGFQSHQIQLHEFSDGFFPAEWSDIKHTFEKLKKSIQPDLILTHYGQDLHQDHRLVSGLTWNTFRDHLIFEYEIPKYEGDLGQPNVYVSLDESQCATKVSAIMESFPSQLGKSWFTEDTFWSMMRIRGVEAGSNTKYAEAFHCRKMAV